MVASPSPHPTKPKKPGTFYRSVWISDIHLCSRDSQAEMVYSFLSSIKCDYLYLVGDIIDVWALRKRWHWPAQYNEVIHKLLKRSRKGAKVTFIPGNHDDFFRAGVLQPARHHRSILDVPGQRVAMEQFRPDLCLGGRVQQIDRVGVHRSGMRIVRQ